MKTFSLTLSLLIIIFLCGCNTAATPTVAATPASRPTATPAPAPTEVPAKPLEDQPQAAATVPASDAPLIAYNEIKEGQLEAGAAVDEWVFKAQAGERVNIVLNSQFDSYLELYGPEGEFIAANDDQGQSLTAALFEVQIKRDGPHTIAVHGYGGATGAYGLALTGGHPTIGGGALANGDSRTVVLSPEGLKWRYQGQQGSYLTITAASEEMVDSHLALYGPDGALLSSDDDSGGGLNAEIFEFQLPADGLYTIQAHSIAKTGLVTLTLASTPQVSGGGPLVLGKSQTGTLKPGRSHRWSFTGQAGQIINLSLSSADFDTFLELRNSQDIILAENDDSAGGSDSTLELFALPADDTYSVIARGLSDQAGGDYEISLKPVKVTPGGGPLAVDKLTQALLMPGQADTWLFEAQAGSFVTVKVQSNQLDTYLELYGPDGSQLSEDDDSGGGLNATLIDFPLPTEGEYRLVVRSAQADPAATGGVYDIMLALTENLVTSGVLASGESRAGSLEAGEQQTWIFRAEEDFFATIKMEAPALDTYLSLYDSSGVLLAANDDFLGKQAVIANFIIPESGEYRIVARSYEAEAAGDYTISLEITEEALPLSESPAGD